VNCIVCMVLLLLSDNKLFNAQHIQAHAKIKQVNIMLPLTKFCMDAWTVFSRYDKTTRNTISWTAMVGGYSMHLCMANYRSLNW
jgi:hypothetical protein